MTLFTLAGGEGGSSRWYLSSQQLIYQHSLAKNLLISSCVSSTSAHIMKHVAALLVILYLVRMSLTTPVQQYEDDRYPDKELTAVSPRELANWLMQMIVHKGEANICTHKRNSEIINSLLGLPKVLNEAGRK